MTTQRRRIVVTARLNRAELALLKQVERFVRSYCGKQPRAEAIRFLIRNWSPP
jgi:hypothetical protein